MSASLSRMFDPINLSFPQEGAHPPSAEEVRRRRMLMNFLAPCAFAPKVMINRNFCYLLS